jgi:hypothetical protein
LQNEGIISGLTIIPNPVANDFILEFESIESGIATVEIFNNSGSLVLKQTNIEVNRGQNKVNIDASLINSGSYKLVVKIRSSFSVKELIIIR